MPRPQNNIRRSTLKREPARELRAAATEFERRFWNLLRRKQMAGLRFRRQQTIGPYIADFYCSAAKLIIELDGGQHSEDEHMLHDAVRTRWLAHNGYRVLRFTNLEFLREPARVIETIWRAIVEGGCPLPDPPREGYGGSTLPQGEGGNS